MANNNFSLYVDKRYTDLSETPMTYFYFVKILRCPLMLFTSVYNIYSFYKYVENDYIAVLTIFNIFIIIFVGIFLWGTIFEDMMYCAYKAYVASLITMNIYVLIKAFMPQDTTNFGNLIGATIYCYLEFVYFKKRELLFNKTNTKNNEHKKNASNEIDVSNKVEIRQQKHEDNNKNVVNNKDDSEKCQVVGKQNKIESHSKNNSSNKEITIAKNKEDKAQPKKIAYCRKCGADLFEDTKFCRKCGCKVETV